MESRALLKKRLVRIETDVNYLLKEINEKKVEKIQKKDALEEFEKLKYRISGKIKEPVDPTLIVREMRTKDYLI